MTILKRAAAIRVQRLRHPPRDGDNLVQAERLAELVDADGLKKTCPGSASG
jgi:hypothetical protein